MRQTFISPVLQYAPQILNLYRHVEPNILFPNAIQETQSTFGRRKKKLGSESQKFRSELIRQANEMNEIVMEDEGEYRKKQQYYKPFDRAMQPQFDPSEPPTTKAPSEGDDDSMTEEKSGGSILPESIDELDVGMGGLGHMDNVQQPTMVHVENGLVRQASTMHAMPYYGNAVGQRGSPQSIVSQKSVISSIAPSSEMSVQAPEKEAKRKQSMVSDFTTTTVLSDKLQSLKKQLAPLERKRFAKETLKAKEDTLMAGRIKKRMLKRHKKDI